MRTFAYALLGAFALAGCGDDEPQAPVDAGPPKTNASLPIDGDPTGLFWDDASATLYVADDANGRVLTYRDATGFAKYVDLPPGGTGLGQVMRLADGTVLVTRAGTGANGDVIAVTADRKAAPIAGLDGAKRRAGLTLAADGRIFDTFVRDGLGGSVAELSLAGTEIEVVSGLTLPIGVLASGESLFIADQTPGKLVKTKLTALGPLTPAGDVPSAAYLCAGPSNTVFVSTGDAVRSVDGAGTPTTLATGFAGARGVAFDAKYRRVFVANHVGAGKNTLEIRPVP